MNIIHFIVLNVSLLFAKPTPTAHNPWIGEITGYTPPTGWVIAGFLLLILIAMVYSEIKKVVKRLIKKKK